MTEPVARLSDPNMESDVITISPPTTSVDESNLTPDDQSSSLSIAQAVARDSNGIYSHYMHHLLILS